MKEEIGTEAAQFPEKEYTTGIFLAVCAEAVLYYSPWGETRSRKGVGRK
jgi:hypothetical protein